MGCIFWQIWQNGQRPKKMVFDQWRTPTCTLEGLRPLGTLVGPHGGNLVPHSSGGWPGLQTTRQQPLLASFVAKWNLSGSPGVSFLNGPHKFSVSWWRPTQFSLLYQKGLNKGIPMQIGGQEPKIQIFSMHFACKCHGGGVQIRLANDSSATSSQNSGFKRSKESFRIDLLTKKGAKFWKKWFLTENWRKRIFCPGGGSQKKWHMPPVLCDPEELSHV